MNKPFQAIFEAGVLRPLEPLPLNEQQVVTLIVAAGDDTRTAAGGLRDDFVDHELLAIAERDGEGAIPLEELRERLKSIRGSMSDVVISERGDY